jgi:ABC-type dipeptide/oligopeptide/nickel transport system permease subunit
VADIAISKTEFAEVPPHISEFSRIRRVFFSRKLSMIGFIIIVIVILTAIFAPFIAPYDPYEMNPDGVLLEPSLKHLVGTDTLGRDTLSRIIYGARTSMMVGIVAIGIAASVGMTLGMIAGYFGGATYMIIMRLVDALMSFPMILLALVLAALLGPGLTNVMIALGVGLTSVYTRLMCSQALTVKENDYITAARSLGESNIRIMLRHCLPNCFPPLIVLITLQMGTAILAEASLSFLGLGIEPPGAAWGSMVNEGYKHLLKNPILSFAPGVAIMLTVFAFNMGGDGIRDALDPRLRGTL